MGLTKVIEFNKRFNKTRAISFNKGWGLILNSDKGDGLNVSGNREGL